MSFAYNLELSEAKMRNYLSHHSILVTLCLHEGGEVRKHDLK